MRYITPMEGIFPYIVIVCMFATAGVLGIGLINMLRRDKNKNKRANAIMRWRVILQGVTLLLFAVLLLTFK